KVLFAFIVQHEAGLFSLLCHAVFPYLFFRLFPQRKPPTGGHRKRCAILAQLFKIRGLYGHFCGKTSGYMALTKAQAREYAKTLFLSENLHQKVIAERVGVTEKTIGRWIEVGGWRKLKRSLLTTKQ